jgi:phosphate transport system protein
MVLLGATPAVFAGVLRANGRTGKENAMSVHLIKEIDRLKKMILSLSAMVEETVQRAVKALDTRDAALAQRVIDHDWEIDKKEVDVEEECLKILALHQPVAIDLRLIIAILKINSDLERIADLAVNIAERSLFLASQERLPMRFNFVKMGEKAQAMLRKSLDALVNLDADLARVVCSADDEVDAMNREAYLQVEESIRRHPDKMEALIHLLSVSRHLERIADHATNIAEDVIYMCEGQIVRHRSEDYLHHDAPPASR